MHKESIKIVEKPTIFNKKKTKYMSKLGKLTYRQTSTGRVGHNCAYCGRKRFIPCVGAFNIYMEYNILENKVMAIESPYYGLVKLDKDSILCRHHKKYVVLKDYTNIPMFSFGK